jgi:hypothetical protein
MPHNVTEAEAFTALVPVPDPGEPAMAADLEGAAEALANRTKFLRQGKIQFKREFPLQIDDADDGTIINIGPNVGEHTSRFIVLPELTADTAIALRNATGAGGDPPPHGTIVRISRGRKGGGGLPDAFTLTIGEGSETGGTDLIRFNASLTAYCELIFLEGPGFGYTPDHWQVLFATGGFTILF